MKIGIITWWKVDNYGAVLLAYSMNKTLKNLGFDVQFIDYDRLAIKKKPTIKDKILYFKPSRVKNRKFEKQKKDAFDNFRYNNLAKGCRYADVDKLACIIIGSDQIFDISHEYYDYQFGVNSSVKKIAYAPSFGETTVDIINQSSQKRIIKDAINDISFLSARDRNTYNILSVLTSKHIVEVIDPVLLYGFKEEFSLWNKQVVSERYLIVYAWGGWSTTNEFANSVSNFALRNNLVTVSVGDYRKWCKYNFPSASPEEFVNLFKNSSMVITNMFHGTCFSLLCEKPFYSVVMKHNSNKLGDLLEKFDLSEQAVYDLEKIDSASIPCIDYNLFREKLNIMRTESLEFLKNIK